jgi:hypothetical protein
MRIRSWGVALIALAMASVSMRASATLVTLPVTGGPGLDQGEVCLTTSLCPGTPVLSLVGNAPVSGSLVFNDVANTVDFSLTLLVDASFGAVAAGAGSTFVATGIPVMKIPIGGGAYQIVQLGTGSALVSIIPVPPASYTVTANTPDVSGLTCVVGTGSDQCGLSLGPGGFGLVDPALTPYQAFVSFNVNVPEPATLGLLGVGTGALLWFGRRRT